jgi:hypothetical protein
MSVSPVRLIAAKPSWRWFLGEALSQTPHNSPQQRDKRCPEGLNVYSQKRLPLKVKHLPPPPPPPPP